MSDHFTEDTSEDTTPPSSTEQQLEDSFNVEDLVRRTLPSVTELRPSQNSRISTASSIGMASIAPSSKQSSQMGHSRMSRLSMMSQKNDLENKGFLDENQQDLNVKGGHIARLKFRVSWGGGKCVKLTL